MRATRGDICLSQKKPKRFLGPVEATNNNSRKRYQNWIDLKSTGPSNRSWEFLGLMTSFCV